MKEADAKNPKLDKKWWTDRASKVTQGQGMEAALDAWSKSCHDSSTFKTEEEFLEAFEACEELDEAIKKADKKCGSLAQKETKLCLNSYRATLKAYRDRLMGDKNKFNAKQKKRAEEAARLAEEAEEQEREVEQVEELERAAVAAAKALQPKLKAARALQGDYDSKFAAYVAAKKTAGKSTGNDIYDIASKEDLEFKKKAFQEVQQARPKVFGVAIKAVQDTIKQFGKAEAMKPLTIELRWLESTLQRDAMV